MRELREVQGVNMDRIKIPRLYLSSFGYIKGCGILKVQVQSSHQTKSVAGGLQVTHYCEFTKYIKFHNFIKIQYKIQFFLNIYKKMSPWISVVFCAPISPSNCIIFKRLYCCMNLQSTLLSDYNLCLELNWLYFFNIAGQNYELGQVDPVLNSGM